jgi:hypothetical protein
LDDLVARALEKRADERYESAQVMADALELAARGL